MKFDNLNEIIETDIVLKFYSIKGNFSVPFLRIINLFGIYFIKAYIE